MKIIFSVLFLAVITTITIPYIAHAWTPIPVKDDPLVRMPGTQQDGGATFQHPSFCNNLIRVSSYKILNVGTLSF